MSTLELKTATASDFAAIENMMQFYMDDFSEYLPLPLNSDGFSQSVQKLNIFLAPELGLF